MAAWLAFLKSILPLIPLMRGQAAKKWLRILRFSLNGFRRCAIALRASWHGIKRRDFFVRGIPENAETVRTVNYTANLLDLMQAYSRIRTRDEFRPFVMDRNDIFTMEKALERMHGLIGFAVDCGLHSV